ncbi:MAG TPA: iron-containing alcohol dehydrogenase [Chthoniobacter sp.]|nr:iron-containing alcohol dehydrogenase [Chthoniobacter sp.]
MHAPTHPLGISLQSFDFQPRTRLIFGPETLEQVGVLARELGGKHVLLVTDKGIAAAGHPTRAVGYIEAAGLHVTIFDEVRENPTTVDVDRCVEVARTAGIDLIVGIGGGSSMDTAKGANFILTNGGHMKDYWGVGKATKPMLPMIAIPTTAGTGSECQSFALISDEQTHLKMACGDSKAAAKIAILDPLLTVSQPPRVTACTGIDTLVHAVETAVTKKRTPLSAIYSREAFKLCLGGLERVLTNPQDLEARGMMQLSAAFAGTAIENSMLGAAHSAANPLTARFGVVHGQAVGLMLPAVIAFNARDPLAHERYMELSEAVDLGPIEEFVAELEVLLDVAKMREGLSKYGIDPKQFPSLAKEAAQQWTASFNPRAIAAEDFERLYEEVFG